MAMSEDTPELVAVADRAPEAEPLGTAYRLCAELFVNPEQTNRPRLVTTTRDEVIPAVAADIDQETGEVLRSFLAEYEDMEVDSFIQLHELSPTCPLYLGHFGFDEPETCREIVETDRNQYMVELNAIYEHFGFAIGDELPDYLPAMVEFCWLTLPDRDDELRAEFQRMMLALLPPMRERFDEAETPYRHLLAVVDRLLRYDLTGDATASVDAPNRDELIDQSSIDSRAASTGGGN